MLQSKKRCIWANYPGEMLEADKCPVFPNAEYAERSLSASDVNLLMTSLSPLYQGAVSSAAKVAAGSCDFSPLVYEVLLRDSVVLTTYMFFDRLLRLKYLLSELGDLGTCTVASPPHPHIPETMSELANGCDGSQEFNQYILARLAAIWRIPLDSSRPLLANVKNTKAIKNLNFDETSLSSRVIRKLTRLTSARWGKFPTLSLANSEDVLLNSGLYGIGKLAWVPLTIPKHTYIRDNILRRKMKRELRSKVAPLFFEMCTALGWKDSRSNVRSLIAYTRMLTDFLPPARLEGAGAYRYCEEYLQRFTKGKLWFSGMPGEKEIFWIAAAKKIGMPVVGVQHGAHYGFSKQPCHIELEYAYCDAFATWGWDVFPDSPITQHIKPMPLPSPWLSGRQKKWGKLRIESEEAAFDVLLMTDRLQFYPPSLTTLRMSRLDFLEDISKSFVSLVDGLCAMGANILHKPFNYSSKEIQSAVITDLCKRHPYNYSVHEQLDKGLTDELLKQCRIVLWDEPGTGFFECLIAGMPTMVYWPRITSHEEPYARDMFAKLEAVGLVHSDKDQLMISIRNYLGAQKIWKEDSARKIVIQEALHLWARTDRNWARIWKKGIAKM